MLRKLRPVSGMEAVRALNKLGFVQVRQRVSHAIVKKQLLDGSIGCVVPLHPQIAVGTLRSIIKQAGITIEDFYEAVESI